MLGTIFQSCLRGNPIVDKGSIGKLSHFGNFIRKESPAQMLRCEIEDLRTLSKYVLVPEIVLVEDNFFIMRYYPPKRVNFKLLTELLESLHSVTSNYYGYHRPSFYGYTPLDNSYHSEWWPFFLSTRLAVLISKFEGPIPRILRFIGEHISLLGVPERPALLHGDLWVNNVLFDGTSLRLIDPSCFYGDPLMDFARYGNRYSSHIRAQFYKAYYALDRDVFLGKTEESEDRLKKVVQFICRKASMLKLNSLTPPSFLGRLSRSSLVPRSFSAGLVYFGCFNPPHKNHLGLIERAQVGIPSETSLYTWYCPAPNSYLRQKLRNLGENEDKALPLLERERLLCNHPIMTFVCDHATTLEILSHLCKELYVVTGSDSIEKALKQIPEKYSLIVVERVGYPIKEEFLGRKVIIVRGEEERISSTMIRSMVISKSDNVKART